MKDMIHIMLKIETFTPFKGLIETSIQSKKKRLLRFLVKDMIHIMLKIETFTPFKGLIETSIQSKKRGC